MYKLIFISSLLFSLTSWASVELKVGDILLQPLKCWSCSLIEAEEETIYSHVGIVVAVKPEIIVAEALGKVKTLPFKTFHARTRTGGKLSVQRLVSDEAVEHLQNNQPAFFEMYMNWFHGAKYDHQFLWNNLDENGVESFYCSEMVTKLIQGFLGIELPTKEMHFERNRDQWMRFFKGTPPDGMRGNSPGDLERSDKLYEVGEI